MVTYRGEAITTDVIRELAGRPIRMRILDDMEGTKFSMDGIIIAFEVDKDYGLQGDIVIIHKDPELDFINLDIGQILLISDERVKTKFNLDHIRKEVAMNMIPDRCPESWEVLMTISQKYIQEAEEIFRKQDEEWARQQAEERITCSLCGEKFDELTEFRGQFVCDNCILAHPEELLKQYKTLFCRRVSDDQIPSAVCS